MILSVYLERLCGTDYITEPYMDFDEELQQVFVSEVHYYIKDGILLAFDIRKILNECPNIDSLYAKDNMLVIVEKV